MPADPAPKPSTMTKEQLFAEFESMLNTKLAEVQKQIAANQDADRQSTLKAIIEAGRPPVEVPAAEKGIHFARYVRCLRAAQLKGNVKPQDIAIKLGDPVVAKALSETVFGQGGALVPPDFSAEIIDLLRPASVVRASQPRTMRLVNGQATVPFVATGVAATYVGENLPATRSEPTFGQLQLNAKKLAVITPISNDLLRDGDASVDALVRDDIVAAMAQREDIAFIRDTGAANTPMGMRQWVAGLNAANLLTETNVAGVVNGATNAEITLDLARMLRRLLDANVRMARPGWIFTPRVWSRLYGAVDANNQPIWRAEMDQGKLMGYPFKLTTQIPGTLSDPIAVVSTEVYLAEFSDLVIADSLDIEVTAFDGATYFDGAAFVSGVSNDQTVLRALARHDFGCRRRGAEVVVMRCTWGTV